MVSGAGAGKGAERGAQAPRIQNAVQGDGQGSDRRGVQLQTVGRDGPRHPCGSQTDAGKG